VINASGLEILIADTEFVGALRQAVDLKAVDAQSGHQASMAAGNSRASSNMPAGRLHTMVWVAACDQGGQQQSAGDTPTQVVAAGIHSTWYEGKLAVQDTMSE
jgi:hypothetical protein